MRVRGGLRNSLLVVGTVAVLGACAGNTDTPAPSGTAAPTGSQSSAAPSADPQGNGQLYTSQFGGGETTLRRYPIAADGSVGTAVVILKEAGDDTTFPAVVDSLGQTVLTGTYTDYWTTELQRRDLAGKETGKLTVDHWCGGEGLVANLCTLLSDTQLARTTELGGEETTTDGSVLISDLTNGSTVRQWGPFPGLSRMLGTTEPTTVLLATTTEKGDIDDPNVPGTIVRLDTTTGQTSEVGAYPKDWNALCAVGVDGVIGQTLGAKPKLVGVGTTPLGKATITEDDSVVGCSADGAFLYIQNVSQPPTGEEDEEPPGTDSALERIDLATGERTTIGTMPAGEWVGPVTR